MVQEQHSLHDFTREKLMEEKEKTKKKKKEKKKVNSSVKS